MPGLIYGIPDNPLVDAGIQHPNSIAIPALIKVALDRKQPGIVGQGVSRWPNISVDDSKRFLHQDDEILTYLQAANIYIALYNAIREDPDKVPHGREGYYFGENGEHDWKGLSRIVGQALVELGLITNPEPSTFTEDELIKYFGSLVGSLTTSCDATHLSLPSIAGREFLRYKCPLQGQSQSINRVEAAAHH